MIPHYYPADARFYLREELTRRQTRRPQYSLRAFARDLEMSPSFLCEFLAGRQGVSRERVHWMAKKLNLSEDQREHFWDLVEAKFGRSPQIKKMANVRVIQRSKSDTSRLSLERFRLIAEWYHLVLLEILTLPNSKFTVVELAAILNVTDKEIRQGIARLRSLGLLAEVEVEGHLQWQVSEEITSTEEDGDNKAIQLAHFQMLHMQAEQIEAKDISQRESLSISFSLDDTDWPQFRRELKEAIVKVVTKYGIKPGNKNQVVCLSAQAVSMLEINKDTKQ